MESLSMSGLILAGGQGSRMGGQDKGLQLFKGKPLVMHAIERLQRQDGAPLSSLVISANRNLSSYQAFGLPVWTDADAGLRHNLDESSEGPLVGMLTGLKHCTSDLLLTVPCDSPFFPLNLAQSLCAALLLHKVDMAVAATPKEDGVMHIQPVFCLMRAGLQSALWQFINQGGRKLGAWAASQSAVWVPFDGAPSNRSLASQVSERHHFTSAHAFSNLNTLEELHKLELADLSHSPQF
jgi:molybdopterin-guanine dinucleotide biosynthesis protein A